MLGMAVLFLIGCAAPSVENTDLEVLTMKLTSSAFAHNKNIPSKYTCDGKNSNPPLTISEVPAGTKSLVLIMDDPDAVKPAGKVWDHWIMWNIPAETRESAEGEEPQGIPGRGTGQLLGYQGPCPPDTTHRYFFTIYALDVKIDIPVGSTKAEVEEAMEGHVLDQAELVGRYGKT